jgi:hypothetical protein
VRQGDWKLIRNFNDGPNQTDRYELYNLHDDLEESHNLAAAQPERVNALNELLSGFLKDTQAVIPGANPAYTAKAPRATATAAPEDSLHGWKLRGCEGSVNAGALSVTGKSPTPFLAFAAGKFAGPTVVKFRLRSAVGGAGKVEWLPKPQAIEQAKSVPFAVTAGEWQEKSVSLPATGLLGIVRLYLPANHRPVQLSWIEFQSADGQSQRWDF